MRVAHVNMSKSGASCPQGLTQKILSNLTLCGQNGNSGCQSTTFSSLSISYSQVCGQLRGYQYGNTDAFAPYNWKNTFPDITNSQGYFEGASITYGTAMSRKHIWTYANGVSLRFNADPTFLCPCNTGSTAVVPPYVGSDYYCETGNNGEGSLIKFFPDDPLWDGQQCPGEEAPCCTRPKMPWFIKSLNETTTEEIELKLCYYNPTPSAETLLNVIALYVK